MSFFHAILSSDTSSRPFGLGKGTCCCHKVQHHVKLHTQAAVFHQPRPEKNHTIGMYGSYMGDGPGSLRFNRLTNSVSRST